MKVANDNNDDDDDDSMVLTKPMRRVEQRMKNENRRYDPIGNSYRRKLSKPRSKIQQTKDKDKDKDETRNDGRVSMFGPTKLVVDTNEKHGEKK